MLSLLDAAEYNHSFISDTILSSDSDQILARLVSRHEIRLHLLGKFIVGQYLTRHDGHSCSARDTPLMGLRRSSSIRKLRRVVDAVDRNGEHPMEARHSIRDVS